MAVELALAMWSGMAVSFVATVFIAILAGRGHRLWQVIPLLILEFLLLGAAIVFWMFLVWFSAKVVTSLGISAAVALIVALVTGMALAVLTVVGGLRLVRVTYMIFGFRDRYDVDFGDSLWFRTTGTWRPKEFRQS